MKLISITEQKPADGLYVLVAVQHRYDPWDFGRVTRTYHLATIEHDEDGKEFWWGHDAGKKLRNVAHWAYLPDMPDAPAE